MTKRYVIGIGVIGFIGILISSVVYFMHSAFLEKFRYENIIGINTAITVYVGDYGNTFPGFDQWCDRLVAEADCSPSSFYGILNSQEGQCGYALNENLKGRNFSELPDQMVLAFEAKGPWNLIGGPELMKKTKHKDIAVVFMDGYMDFVTVEEVDSLNWKP